MGKDQELLEAARNGNISVVEKILSQRAKRSGPLASLRRGPGANVQDASGYSALHHAALNGHREVVQLLLAHEASTNIVDGKGSSPLHLAAWAGNVDIVRLLLCHGPSVPNVNLTTKDNETALHCAAQYGHTAVVGQLLEHGCDPAIRNSREETALDLAAQYGRLETVELLVRTHPELIQPYTCPGAVFPHTPLHLASRNGHRAVVGVLLAAGMAVNARTAAGTALHEAAMYGKLEVVRALLAAGVDVCARDQRRHTVMELLGQFPAHVTHDIAAIISRHRETGGGRSGSDDLPPIPVPDTSLGSPYENVRTPGRGGGGGGVGLRGQSPASSPGTSPTHWHYYRSVKLWRFRKGSGAMPTSVASDGGMYQTPPPPPKSLPDSFLSAEEGDRISVSSSSSLYMPMCGSGGGHAKVSPTPPKKPPRRNLSVSPTHATPPALMSLSADSGGCRAPQGHNYEYLYLARSGRSHGDLRRGRSADQYVDMRPPVALLATSAHEAGAGGLPLLRAQNPRRKLRRSHHYENYEPPATAAAPVTVYAGGGRGRLPAGSTFVSNAYITLRPSQESLVDAGAEAAGARPVQTPLSPTHYQQPPTPDHPPPSALQAERSIHERIRPLSQEYKRRSRDMETETEEELLLCPSLAASSGSLSSSVSLSDKSVSTDNNVEEFLADAPFAGKYRQRSGSLLSERPSALPDSSHRGFHNGFHFNDVGHN
ncbi:ankyrin repeat and SAM domain-containing protein 1A-like [Schistocerca piceifrons]|uniref:ankyrin repeat and SAM domain-containing protein 1A-like n=1 Tax=Schistocerca piceifrons TaxID=274613 RepID=UPI001F5F3A2F|nr:ankyrin repeat and SAM domain-containing protein 1A-like [Schistocerca piceifrons]